MAAIWLLVPKDATTSPQPVDAVGVDDVAYEGEHRHTAMLDLGFAEETDGRLVPLLPEFLVAESERIPEADDRVRLAYQ